MNGFALGVAYYNEKNGTRVEVLGWDVEKQDGLFTGNFMSTDDGRRVAEQLMDQGADIILPVAGRVGLGAAAAVKEHRNAYLIGVDTDWAVTYPEYAGIILTSVMKRMDVSVVSAVQAIVDGTFAGGTHPARLRTAASVLHPSTTLDGLITAQVRADLEQIKRTSSLERSRLCHNFPPKKGRPASAGRPRRKRPCKQAPRRMQALILVMLFITNGAFVHHLMVLGYHLQHPNLYSPEGLEYSLRLLVDFVEHGVSTQQVRRRARATVNSGQRKWKIRGKPGSRGSYEHPVRWSMTAFDVMNAGADRYIDSVQQWVRSILADLRSTENYHSG